MPKPSLRIMEIFSVALETMENSLDLTPMEEEWLRQFASRLIVEFSTRTPEGTVSTRS